MTPAAGRAGWVRGWIDATLGRLTPVITLISALAIIVVHAFIASALGLLPFDPLAGIVSLVAIVIGAYAGGFAGAAIARARTKADSTLATALILFLLFTPSTDFLQVVGVAIAGFAAGLSKYALAWRGRHLFNPAAVGATVGWLTTLATPGWWVGSGTLVWTVLVLAIVVSYRTGTMLTGLAYVVLATAGTWLSVPGSEWALFPGLILALPFTSLPTLFLAGFMLSEPLTLPPRRWQRLVVAAVVAVCSFLPTMLAAVVPVDFMPTEVALLVGNLVAWCFGMRRAIRFDVVEAKTLGGGVAELELLPRSPLRFQPGQAIELEAPHAKPDLRGRLRVLSLVSAPADPTTRVAFTVPTVHASSAKRALVELEPGDAITGTRVLGDFVLPRDPAKPVLLVAGGIGVTPFVSMLRANAAAIAAGRPARDLVLVYRSSVEHPAYAAELAALPGARLIPFFAERPDAAAIATAIPDLPMRTAYVSGPPRMVAALSAMLRRAGVRRVRRDVFSGA